MKKATHIFIVDNNKLFVSMLGYIFTKSDFYCFTEFETGEDCLNNLQRRPTLIVLDYNLPGMNGYDTLLEIKEQHPLAHVLVLVSGNDNKSPYELIKAGADDIILKEEGNFVKKVIEKVENFLNRTFVPRKNRLPEKKTLYYYYILILILISASIYYY